VELPDKESNERWQDINAGRRGEYRGDDGMDTLALLNPPTSVVVDRAGNLYFSDQGNNVIRSILPNGKVNRIA